MKKILFVAALFVLMQSCITSLYPLYTDATLVAKNELIATWKGKDSFYWKFYKADDSKMYSLRCRTGRFTAEYSAGLVKIGDNYFMDLKMLGTPLSDDEKKRINAEEEATKKTGKESSIDGSELGLLAMNVSCHNFYKLGFKGGKIYVYPFNEDYLKELFKQRKIRIKQEKVDEYTTLLTASTKELQEFFQKYGNDPKLFEDDPEILTKYTK